MQAVATLHAEACTEDRTDLQMTLLVIMVAGVVVIMKCSYHCELITLNKPHV